MPGTTPSREKTKPSNKVDARASSQEATIPAENALKSSGRVIETDKLIGPQQITGILSNRLFLRLGAKGRRFQRVDFKYSIFDACYLRDCEFDSCDFTGVRFVASNLSGSTFLGCKFDYAVFERTFVNPEILETSCPATENLIARFARSLRINFQQIGDAQAVNRAITVELSATKQHLYKAWRSGESYYRKKYPGVRRVQAYFQWLRFVSEDFVWGNGESVFKLFRTIALTLILITPIDIGFDPQKSFSVLTSYSSGLLESFEIFLGVYSPTYYPKPYASIVVLLRLIVFGLMISIIVKRRNRR